MIKQHCDGCGKELEPGENRVSQRLEGSSEVGKLKTTVLVRVELGVSAYNTGEICHTCAIKAITALLEPT